MCGETSELYISSATSKKKLAKARKTKDLLDRRFQLRNPGLAVAKLASLTG